MSLDHDDRNAPPRLTLAVLEQDRATTSGSISAAQTTYDVVIRGQSVGHPMGAALAFVGRYADRIAEGKAVEAGPTGG